MYHSKKQLAGVLHRSVLTLMTFIHLFMGSYFPKILTYFPPSIAAPHIHSRHGRFLWPLCDVVAISTCCQQRSINVKEYTMMPL